MNKGSLFLTYPLYPPTVMQFVPTTFFLSPPFCACHISLSGSLCVLRF